jgi:uncharacterized membrane protein YdjX (TVP38/TMEM64 family)
VPCSRYATPRRSSPSSFTALAGGDKETLRETLLGFGVLAPLASILLNVAQAVVAPVPGFVVPFVNGAVFGTWTGMLVTWIGGIAAAATCFGISRTFGRSFAERICRRSAMAERLNERLERHSFMPIVAARLIPGVPFDFLSYFVGLTRIRFAPFIAATAVGSAPHAFLYAFMGSSLEFPLWLGVLMTPALGAIWAAGAWTVRALRGDATRGAEESPAGGGVGLTGWAAGDDVAACHDRVPVAPAVWAAGDVVAVPAAT